MSTNEINQQVKQNVFPPDCITSVYIIIYVLFLSSLDSTWSHWWSSSSASSPSTLCQHLLTTQTPPPPLLPLPPLPSVRKITTTILWPLRMTSPSRKWLWGSPLRRRRKRRGGRATSVMLLVAALSCELQHRNLLMCLFFVNTFIYWVLLLYNNVQAK